jgi:hypothetical protein
MRKMVQTCSNCGHTEPLALIVPDRETAISSDAFKALLLSSSPPSEVDIPDLKGRRLTLHRHVNALQTEAHLGTTRSSQGKASAC